MKLFFSALRAENIESNRQSLQRERGGGGECERERVAFLSMSLKRRCWKPAGCRHLSCLSSGLVFAEFNAQSIDSNILIQFLRSCLVRYFKFETLLAEQWF
jgi:hypothetical protein